MKLNTEQRQAVTYDKGPLLVSAGPGSGKTRVITERVAFLLKKKKLKPSEILCLTFSDAGADTMRKRLEEMNVDITDLRISTYHSFCNEILRDFSVNSAVGTGRIVKRASFLVWGLENIDSFGFDKWLDVKNIKSVSSASELIEKLIDGISTFKDELITPKEIETYVKKELKKHTTKTDWEEVQKIHELDNLIKIYKKYDEYKRKQGVLDFDDLIVLTNELLADPKKKHILNHLQNMYKHILIDEFQDNNFAQFSIVKKLVTKGNVTAVGDDDQSIYRFQGAYPEIFNDFLKSFKGAKTIHLKKNYRNIKSVVELSSELLKQDSTRKAKTIISTSTSKDKVFVIPCRGELAQAEFVKNKIIELKKKNSKLKFGDFAVLARKQVDGLLTASMLTASGIPVRYVGKSNIFNSPGARSLISYLSIIANPAKAGKYINRILEDHGVPDNDIAVINTEAKKRAWGKEWDCVMDVISDLKLSKIKVQTYSGTKLVQPKVAEKNQIRSVYKMLDELIEFAKNNSTSRIINEVLRERTNIFKKTTLQDTFENYIERSILMDLEENATDLQTLKPNSTINDFLKYIEALEKFEVETEQGSEFSEFVQVGTLHKSKGKEFPYVFVIGVGDRQLPQSYRTKMFYVPKGLSKGLQPAVDSKTNFTNEERRVLYVGMTRAVNNLFISWSNVVSVSGNKRKVSDFLEKLAKNKKVWNNYVKELPEFGGSGKGSAKGSSNPIDIIKNEVVELAVKNVISGQYQTAVQAIIDLDTIKHYKGKKTLKGAKLSKNLKIKTSTKTEKRLQGMKDGSINISDLTLSASKFGTYKKCPKQFKFQYIWKVPSGVTSIPMYKGDVFHKVVQTAGEAQKNGKILKIPQLIKEFDRIWDIRQFFDHSKKDEREGRNNVRYMLGEYFKWAKASKNKVIDIEKEFGIMIDGVLVKGKIDRVEETPKGELIVYDYKTGMSQSGGISTDLQLNVYSLACKKLYKKYPDKAILFYPLVPLNHKQKERFRVYDVTEKNVKKIEKRLIEMVQKIKQLNFVATPTTRECGYCDYRNICTEAM